MELKIIPLKPPFRLTIFGKSGAGKTTTAANMLLKYYSTAFRKTYLIDPSYEPNSNTQCPWDDLNLPENRIFDEFSEEAFSDIVNRIDTDDFKYQEEMLLDQKEYIEPQYLIIIDNSGAQGVNKGGKRTTLDDAIIRIRHKRITLVTLLHQVTMASTPLRNNSDGMIFFYPTNNKEKAEIYDFMPTKESESKKILDQCTENLGDFLFVHLQSPRPLLLFKFDTWLELETYGNQKESTRFIKNKKIIK